MKNMDLNAYLEDRLSIIENNEKKNHALQYNLRDMTFQCNKSLKEFSFELKQVLISDNKQTPEDFYNSILKKMNVDALPIHDVFFEMIEKRNQLINDGKFYKENLSEKTKIHELCENEKTQAFETYHEMCGKYDACTVVNDLMFEFVDALNGKNVKDVKELNVFDKMFVSEKCKLNMKAKHLIKMMSSFDELVWLNFYDDFEKIKKIINENANKITSSRYALNEKKEALEKATNALMKSQNIYTENKRKIEDLNDVYIIHRFFDLINESESMDLYDLCDAYSVNNVKQYIEDLMTIKVCNHALDSLRRDQVVFWGIKSLIKFAYLSQGKEAKKSPLDEATDFNIEGMMAFFCMSESYFSIRNSMIEKLIKNAKSEKGFLFSTSKGYFFHLLSPDNMKGSYIKTFFTEKDYYDVLNDIYYSEHQDILIENESVDEKSKKIELPIWDDNHLKINEINLKNTMYKKK